MARPDVIDPGGRTACLRPTRPLAPRTSCEAEITAAVEDAYGIGLGLAKVWSFTTGDG